MTIIYKRVIITILLNFFFISTIISVFTDDCQREIRNIYGTHWKYFAVHIKLIEQHRRVVRTNLNLCYNIPVSKIESSANTYSGRR